MGGTCQRNGTPDRNTFIFHDRMDGNHEAGWSRIWRHSWNRKGYWPFKTISERFSKIGSVPELNDKDFNATIQENYDYLKTRISRKINFGLHLPNYTISVPHNKILMSWVIENLVKNAVDAMKGEGSLSISVIERNKNIIVEVQDTGSGMMKQQALNAFKPGYSTKNADGD